MKRTSGLIESIFDPENFRLAYYKASRGKLDRPSVQLFNKNQERNLRTLIQQMRSGDLNFSAFSTFKVRDPKERTICAAEFPIRIIHHAIMNICDPVFEKCQIFDSYASRRNKGTFKALDRAIAFSRTSEWFLKIDVRKFFDSIDHSVLLTQLARLFKDRGLLSVFDDIVSSYETNRGKGVPIGNLTSQYFANHYLSDLDHMIKERLRVKRYVRYMDDMVLWSNQNNQLKEWHCIIVEHLADKLRLCLKPECLNYIDYGLPFLGFRLFKGRILLQAGTRKRYVGKMRSLSNRLAKEAISEDEYGFRALTLIAHVEHANTLGLRRSLTTA